MSAILDERDKHPLHILRKSVSGDTVIRDIIATVESGSEPPYLSHALNACDQIIFTYRWTRKPTEEDWWKPLTSVILACDQLSQQEQSQTMDPHKALLASMLLSLYALIAGDHQIRV